MDGERGIRTPFQTGTEPIYRQRAVQGQYRGQIIAWTMLVLLALILAGCNDSGGGDDPQTADQEYVDEMTALFLSWQTYQWFPPSGGDPAEDNAVREVCEAVRANIEYQYSPESIQPAAKTLGDGIGGQDDMAALAYITLMEEGTQRKDLYLVAALASDGDIHVCLVVNGKAYFTDPHKMGDKLILGEFHQFKTTVINDGTRLDSYTWGGVD